MGDGFMNPLMDTFVAGRGCGDAGVDQPFAADLYDISMIDAVRSMSFFSLEMQRLTSF